MNAWHLLRWGVLIIAIAPLAYYIVCALAAIRFFRQPSRSSDFTPPVSVLKPIKGLDRETYENYASFCQQDYPHFEILFNVPDENDPAIPVIQRIIADFPERQIHLLIGAEQFGTCNKVNKLARMACEAQHDLLVISDSDIRVDPRYLRAVATPFRDSRVGCVTCLYKGLTGNSFGAELEAIGITSDFDAGVLTAWLLGDVDFALGATMATTKTHLAQIGGFEALSNTFTDDYELGNRIHRAGFRVELINHAVTTVFPDQSLGESLRHQVRWNLAIRYARPRGHLGLIFTHGLPWCIAAALIAPSTAIATAYLAGYAILRTLMAWTVGVWGLNDNLLRRKIWLLPLRDAIAFVVWVASFFTRRIEWRGAEFDVSERRLSPASPRTRG